MSSPWAEAARAIVTNARPATAAAQIRRLIGNLQLHDLQRRRREQSSQFAPWTRRERFAASEDNHRVSDDRMLLHYRVGERLGTGASGDVYLAEDLRLHRPVALKMLRTDTHPDDEAAGRLLREARVASSLSHPNIA